MSTVYVGLMDSGLWGVEFVLLEAYWSVPRVVEGSGQDERVPGVDQKGLMLVACGVRRPCWRLLGHSLGRGRGHGGDHEGHREGVDALGAVISCCWD